MLKKNVKETIFYTNNRHKIYSTLVYSSRYNKNYNNKLYFGSKYTWSEAINKI